MIKLYLFICVTLLFLSCHTERPDTTKNKPHNLLNGQLSNASNQAVLCWTSTPNQCSNNQTFFYIQSGEQSPPALDVDHVLDATGRWWKIGWNHAVIDATGHVQHIHSDADDEIWLQKKLQRFLNNH